MNDDRETPLGVKMLADHLVKVKMQYEEQINDLMVRMKKMEKEKLEMQRQYQLLEEEVDTRRREIFILKREDSAQYMLAERENWKALLTQQKQVNAKLQKDLEISRERIKALHQQLEDLQNREQNRVEVKGEDSLDSGTKNDDFHDSVTENENEQQKNAQFQEEEVVRKDALSFGPPQPVTPPEVVEEFSDAYSSALTDQTKLKEEVNRLREEVDMAKKETEEAKQVNVQITDQFMRRVDELEHDHQERENGLLASLEALKLKLDLELEKKWEMMQELREEEVEEREKGGLMSFLWG